MNMLLAVPLVAMLGMAVYSDCRVHRIPNLLLVVGGLLSITAHVLGFGASAALTWLSGLLVGLFCFLPLYAFGGMAAGDVKLMAIAGSYLGALGALWASVFSVICGALIGIGMLFLGGQLRRFFSRYLAIATLRVYIEPTDGEDVAKQRFPYAVAIFLGSVASMFWLRLGQ